jgi:hypothetical protein
VAACALRIEVSRLRISKPAVWASASWAISPALKPYSRDVTEACVAHLLSRCVAERALVNQTLVSLCGGRISLPKLKTRASSFHGARVVRRREYAHPEHRESSSVISPASKPAFRQPPNRQLRLARGSGLATPWTVCPPPGSEPCGARRRSQSDRAVYVRRSAPARDSREASRVVAESLPSSRDSSMRERVGSCGCWTALRSCSSWLQLRVCAPHG